MGLRRKSHRERENCEKNRIVVQAGSASSIFNFLRIHILRTAGLFSAYYISFFIIFKINNRTEAGFLIRLIFQDFASFSKAFKSISRAPPCEKNKNQSSESQTCSKIKNKKIEIDAPTYIFITF